MMPIPSEIAYDLVSKRLTRPAVFKGMLGHWPCHDWNLRQWAERLGEKHIKFRVGPMAHSQIGPLWEGDCNYLTATAKEFCDWVEQKENMAEDNTFFTLNPIETWCYADYKYMAVLFQDDNAMLKMVDWSTFGFNDRSGADSTIWIGSRGAHTPCHYDSYGYNIVAQVYGKKHWTLFPPTQTNYLSPTRIPYEESSIFSSVNMLDPDVLATHPFIKNTTPYSVCLEPGDTLFVPHHWWHLVESVETSVSINTWVEIGLDDDCRIEEGISKAIVTIFAESCCIDGWLNPTEEVASCHETLHYLQSALKRSVCNESRVLIDDDTAVMTKTFSDNLNPKEMCNTSQQPLIKRQRIEDDVGLVEQEKASELAKILNCYSRYVQLLHPLSFIEYISRQQSVTQSFGSGSEQGTGRDGSVDSASLQVIPRPGSSRGDIEADSCRLQKNKVTHKNELRNKAASADAKLLRENYAEGSENPLNPDWERQSDSCTTPSSAASGCETDQDFSRLVLNCIVHPSIIVEITKLLKDQYKYNQDKKSSP